MKSWNALAAHFKRRFGQRAQKIPLDAGATCPNRDGALSRAGCTFCNAIGSGSGLAGQGMSLAEQWALWRAHFLASGKAALFLAYFQSFSNTYGPAARLARLLDELDGLPDLVGLSVGTRPDCVDAEKARLLAAAPWPETWLELGVQTLNDETLRRINRGHDAAASLRAIDLAASAGRVQVCAHLMIGLPGETPDDVLATVERLNATPVHGVKLHNVYVCRGTALEREFLAGDYRPPERAAYVNLAVEALARLRPDIVVHRVVADPAPGELRAPDWARDKSGLVREIEHGYHARMTSQSPPRPTPGRAVAAAASRCETSPTLTRP